MPNWKKVITSGSNAQLNQITASSFQSNGNITVGQDGSGHDVKLFGDTSDVNIFFDASNDVLKFSDSMNLAIGSGPAASSGDTNINSDGSVTSISTAVGSLELKNSGGAIKLQSTAPSPHKIEFLMDQTAAGGTVSSGEVLVSGSAENGVLLNVQGALTSSGNFTCDGELTANDPNLTFKSASFFNMANAEGYGEILDYLPAHGSVNAGDIVFHLNTVWRGGTDASSYAMNMMGVALEDGDGSTACRVLTRGIVRLAAGHIEDTSGDEGDPLYIGTTTGHVKFAVSGTSGDIVRIVGYCLDESKDIIYFNPSATFVEVS